MVVGAGTGMVYPLYPYWVGGASFSGGAGRSHVRRSAQAGRKPLREGVIPCRHCGSRAVVRWGKMVTKRGAEQRYRCKDCGRTFNPLTGTFRARLQRYDAWEAFVRCMADRLTIRATAERVGVDPSTVFRWRHRVLSALACQPRPVVTGVGILEMEELYYPDCRKGQRYLGRKRRRRSHWSTRFAEETVRIILAVGGVAREKLGGAGCLRRLEKWLASFRGVGVHYLHRYLAWFRLSVLEEVLTPEELRETLLAEPDSLSKAQRFEVKFRLAVDAYIGPRFWLI